ncbi:MAG: pantoate--beta-alanine ligase [Flavisolibacter sp.]
MIIFKRAVDLDNYLFEQKRSGKNIAFVPTMGALHQGHLSLVGRARQSGLVVCSIFVNPTQFNDPEDFRNYPVNIANDIELLVRGGCELLFLPSVEEIYPAGFSKKQYDLGPIELTLEGAHRPGHFQGVCQVVDRLLQIVQPHDLFMGQKDYQQCMVIRKLIGLLGMEDKVNLVVVPTVREKDGLAMSSRNLRLSSEQRKKAPLLFETLNFIKDHLSQFSIPELKEQAKKELTNHGFKVDYVEIADAQTLAPLQDCSGSCVALVAASTGKIRLIDNLSLN